MTGQEREALREWELRVCPDCGNHLTAFSLCEHQKGGDGPTGIDFDKFTFVRVLEAEPVERELKELRAALAVREEPQERCPAGICARERGHAGPHRQWMDDRELAAREEPASYDPDQDKRPYNELSSTQQIARERASFLRQLNAVDKELMWKGSGHGRVESIQRLKAAREDTKRPDDREFLVTLDHGTIRARWAPSTSVGEYRDGEQIRVIEVRDTEREPER